MEVYLTCPSCGAQYPEDEVAWRCRCGCYLDLDFAPRFDPASLEGPECFLRYRSVLPLTFPKKALTFGESFTPLHPMVFYGVPVQAKMDFLLTTGSFKDRGAFLMINKCREMGITRIVEDSSGNSACAMAAYSALAGIEAHIFMPAGNSSAKTVQVRTYGATLHKVPGTRSDCRDLRDHGTVPLAGTRCDYCPGGKWFAVSWHMAWTAGNEKGRCHKPVPASCGGAERTLCSAEELYGRAADPTATQRADTCRGDCHPAASPVAPDPSGHQ